MHPEPWTYARIQQFLDDAVEESLHLDYKAAGALAKVPQKKDEIVKDVTAFANSDGGRIYIGVADDGTAPGLSSGDVRRINQLIGNTASQLVRSPITIQKFKLRISKGENTTNIDIYILRVQKDNNTRNSGEYSK